MQLGAPWWFSDHKDGMVKMMKALANTGLLSGFIGMLTDSRSFLSYRPGTSTSAGCSAACWASGWRTGRSPRTVDLIGPMVRDICYGNAAAYFGLGNKP